MSKTYKTEDGKELTQGEYLYGSNPIEPLPAHFIMRRIESLREHREELFKVDMLKRDGVRINAISRAINFWEGLNGY